MEGIEKSGVVDGGPLFPIRRHRKAVLPTARGEALTGEEHRSTATSESALFAKRRPSVHWDGERTPSERPSTRCKRSRALVTHGERPLSFGIWTNSTSVAGTDFAMSHSGSLLGSKGEEEHAGGTMVLGAPLHVGHCKSLRRRAKRLVPFDGPCARFATTITRVSERQSPRRLAVACGRQRAHRSVLWAKQWNTVRGFARNPSCRGVRIVACLALRHRATTRLAKLSTQLDVDF